MTPAEAAGGEATAVATSMRRKSDGGGRGAVRRQRGGSMRGHDGGCEVRGNSWMVEERRH